MALRMNTARIAALTIGLLALAALAACGQKSTPAAVTAVSIDQADSTLVIGGSLPLSATVTATGGAAETVTWSSSDEAIATVSATGLVEAVAVGTANITATSTFDNSRTDSIQVTTALSGSELWTDQFGTTERDYAVGVAVDSYGNVLVAGNTLGDLEGANEGLTDGFIRKYDSSGTPVWTNQFGTPEQDHAVGVAVDSEDNVLLVGYTRGDFEGFNVGFNDVFVLKIDSGGTELWRRQFGSSDFDYATGVAVDSDDNVLLVGYTSGDFQGANAGSNDAFVLKIDSSGTELWRLQFGSSDWDRAIGVAVDSEDNVLIVGVTDGDLEGSSEGGTDAFVIKIDSNSNEIWKRQFGTSEWDGAIGVAADSEDNVLIVGGTEGDLGGINEGQSDVFVTKFSNAGVRGWTHQFGSSDWDDAIGVAVDSEDNVLIAGATYGDLEGSSAGSADAFLTKLNSGGTEIWTRQFGTDQEDYASGVAVDSEDNALIVGETAGDLEGGSAGNTDAFVRKILH